MASAYGNEVTNRLSTMFSPENVMANQARKKQAQEQNALAQIMQKHQGNVDAALPEIAQVSPEYAFKVDSMRKAQQAKLAEQNKPMVLGAGGVVFDPQTRQPIFSAPVKPEKQPDWKDPAYLRYQQNIERFKAGLKPDTSQNKAPPGYRFTSSNDLELIPGGPADEKAKMKSQGSEDVDLAIGALRDAYDRLEQGGGITSSNGGALGNISASASSSVLGQAAGKMLGTKNQSARNDIAMTRPALLAALMRATGMSARQMDSNAELKLWLATATDPTLDVESNRRALNNIEIKYLGKDRGVPTYTSNGGAYDADKEARYQAWKKSQGAK